MKKKSIVGGSKSIISVKKGLFLIGTFILIFGWKMNSSNYALAPDTKTISHVIQIIGCIVLSPVALLNILARINGFLDRKKVIYCILILATVLSVIITKNKSIAYTLLLILSAINLPFSFVLKVLVVSQIISLAFVILSFRLGYIVEVTVHRGAILRHSLGTVSPNYLMLSVFSIIVNILMIKKNSSRIASIVYGVIFAILLYYVLIITDSRMGFMAGIAAICFYEFRNIKILNSLVKKAKAPIIAIPTVLLVASIVLTILYGTFGLKSLNNIFSNRLYLNKKAFETWGVSIFGNDIEYVGQTYAAETPEGYNYIDSAYLNILFQCGAFYSLAAYIYLGYTTKKLYDNKEFFYVILLVIFEIYCFFDSWLFSAGANAILLYGPSFIARDSDIKSIEKATRNTGSLPKHSK